MTFTRRIINLEFELGEGAFGETGKDTVKIEGLRCSANIAKAGGLSMSSLELRVWGMPLEIMNRLTVLNKLAYAEQRYNNVVVSAGDEESGVAVCFGGTIQEAWADGRNAPDVMFHVAAFSGLYQSIKAVPPTSYDGSVDVATVLAGIAQQWGLTFENNGVTGTIEDPYWPGTLGAQLQAIARAANISYFIDSTNRTLAVWPKGEAREGPPILLSAATGMVGYPCFTQNGVQVRSLYNPSLAFGRTVRVESQFTAANHDWVVAAISHNLDSNVPQGQWFTDVECTLLGQAVGIIQ